MVQKKGFTLIELLVVMTIIGLLVVLGLDRLEFARIRSQNSTAKTDISQAAKSIESFRFSDLNQGNIVIRAVGVAGDSQTGSQASPANFRTIFSGEMSVDIGGQQNRYGTRISKTPSNSHVYRYDTSDGTTAPRPGLVSTAGSYIVSTTLRAEPDQPNAFWIQNGATNTGNTIPICNPGAC